MFPLGQNCKKTAKILAEWVGVWPGLSKTRDLVVSEGGTGPTLGQRSKQGVY